MKMILMAFFVSGILPSAFALDGNERINFATKDTETRIHVGSIIKEIESYNETYMPPVLNDFVGFAIRALTIGVSDGAAQTLGSDIENHIRNNLGHLDFSIFKRPDFSIDDFLSDSKGFIEQIEHLKADLKKTVPDSHHSYIDGGISEIYRQLNDYRMEYLANRISKNSSEKSEVINHIYHELNEKIAKLSESSFLKKEVERLDKLVEEMRLQGLAEKDGQKKEEVESQLMKLRNLQQAEFKSKLSDIYNMALGVSSLIGLQDQKTAELVMSTTSSFLQIANSAFAINSGLTGSALFGHYGLMASASVQLLQSWGVLGRKQKDGFASAFKAISEQIKKLQERMDSRFDRIESVLFQYHRQVLDHFSRIHSSLDSLDASINRTHEAVISLKFQIESNTLDHYLNNAKTYLENNFKGITLSCLKQNLQQDAALACLKSYQSFITHNLTGHSLTEIGEKGKWYKYIDFQINKYAQELGHFESLPNLALLYEVELQLNKMDQLNPHLNLKNKVEFKKIKNLIQDKKNDIRNIVSPEAINTTIDTVNIQISDIRSKINTAIKKELYDLSFRNYLNDLEQFKNELSLAINDRKFEISTYRPGKNAVESSLYISGVKETVRALELDKGRLENFLISAKKKDWTSIIYDSKMDFPIIIRPKNEAVNHKTKPFVVFHSELVKIHPYLKLSGFTLASAMNYDFDVNFHKDKNYLASISLSGYLSYEGLPKTMIFDITDTNRSCARGLRRVTSFKNAPDPYGMSVIFKKGHFKNNLLNESCGPSLTGNSNSERAQWNLSSSGINLGKLDEHLQNIVTKRVMSHLKTQFQNSFLQKESSILENNLAKLKGLIYLKYQDELSGNSHLLTQFSAITSEYIYSHLSGQHEYVMLTGKGTVLSDVSQAVTRWYH